MKDGRDLLRGLKNWFKDVFRSGDEIRVGAKVVHPSYGEGVIEKIEGSGSNALVCVDFGYAKPFLPLSELRLEGLSPTSKLSQTPIEDEGRSGTESHVSETGTDSTPEIVDTVSSELDATDYPKPHGTLRRMTQVEIEARKGIMALRLGQVLESQVLKLSVGTKDLERQLKEAISKTAANVPTFLLMDAAWGAGKTHALTMLQVLAREAKFATSYVVMDGVSTSLAYPMELMSELMSSLRFPGNTKSSDLCHHIAEAKLKERVEILQKQGAHLIADAMSSLPMEAFDDPDVLDILTEFFLLKLPATHANKELAKMNYRARIPSIKAFRINDRVPRFVSLLSEWTVFCSVMGCRGLLVVMDELDVEYAASAYGTKKDYETIERRRDLLKELANLTNIPLLIAFAAAPGDPSLDLGEDPIRDVLYWLDGNVIHIKVPFPGKEELRLLLERLAELYGDAFNVQTAKFNQDMLPALFQELYKTQLHNPNGATRRFVRGAIERMDILLGTSPGRYRIT